MLQQTQVVTVLPYYKEWLRRFPDFAALAAAPQNDVLHAWQGLGYYARARNLHGSAKTVQDRHGGIFPNDIAAIRALPGIGRYTANAIATFAFDQSVPVVEANVARVIARLFNVTVPIDSTAGQEILWNRAASLVPKRNPGRFNSALMDLGALVCLPRQPKCSICPVKTFCRARNPEALPRKKARPRTKQLIENHAFVFRQKKILLERSAKRWRGMWMLPPINARSTSSEAVHTSIFPFTNHRVTLRVFARRPGKIDNLTRRWFAIEELSSIPIPSPHRRAIEQQLAAA